MLNKEKFVKEIVEIACNGSSMAIVGGKPENCQITLCGRCICRRGDCVCDISAITEWANSEYVEPPVDWSKVAVDTPILVRNSEKEVWEKRHFAKYENAIVYAWVAGETSWSADSSNMTDWKMAKLAESEE